jgi:hypothetical protein
VEIIDSQGKVLGKNNLSGNSLKHNVKFEGESFWQIADNKPIRFRFTVSEGRKLFSFTTDNM